MPIPVLAESVNSGIDSVKTGICSTSFLCERIILAKVYPGTTWDV